MPRWGRWWKAWVIVGIAAELLSLRGGTPLTGVVRRYLTPSRAGSVLLGAFLAWLPYHWLAVQSGMGWGDVVVVVLGGLLGAGSVALRERGGRGAAP
jgi:hypothetical protein